MKRKSKVSVPIQRTPRKSGELDDLREFVRIYDALMYNKTLEGIAKETANDLIRVHTGQLTKVFARIEQRYKTRVLGTIKPLGTTDEGLRLWARAREVLEGLEGLQNKPSRPVVHIASIDAGVHFWIAPALADTRFLKKNDIDLSIHTRENWDVTRDVKMGIADFGITTRMDEPMLTAHSMLRRPHVIVLPSSHRLSNEDALELKDLEGETLVTMREGITPLDVCVVLRERRISVRTIRTLNLSHVITFVRHGLGVGILTEDMAMGQSGIVWKKIFPPDALPIAEDFIYTRPDEETPVAAKAVIKQILSYWKTKNLETRMGLNIS